MEKAMFQITIDDTVQAVSSSLENILNALPDIIYDYTGVKIPNSIELQDRGRDYHDAIMISGDEVFTIVVTKIPVI